MKKNYSILFCFLIILFVSCNYVEQNINVGNTIVKKIDEYKTENGTLPISLVEIEQDEIIDGVLFCYEKIDSINYIVWFGTTLGEGMYYFSDTREWEDQLRSVSNENNEI